MFYHVSSGRYLQPIGRPGSVAQKTAISDFVGVREERRKNQQSRVERPITDWTVSWSCLGIGKYFIPKIRRHRGLTGSRAADGWELLARTDLPYKTGESRSVLPIISVALPPIEDDILDVYPTTAETTSPQATLFIV